MSHNWEIALEQDRGLETVRGSVEEVARAVARGSDLRLYMTTETYEETLYFQQTYSGEGDAFAGLMSHHHSYMHRGRLPAQPYFSFFKYDVSGRFSHVKWMLDNQVFDESQAYGYGVYRWFVCDRWRLVYEHDAHGERVHGDIEELKEHVRAGRTLRVGIRQLFGLADDETRGPAHLSFLTTMQPVIQDGQVLSNCDFVLVGAPHWPFTWKDGLHLAMMQPSTSGEITSYLAEPGKLPFERAPRRRGMRWLVAESA